VRSPVAMPTRSMETLVWPRRRSFEQLGNDEGRAVVRTEIEDHKKVAMIERAGGPRFLLEPLQMIAILRHGHRKNFDGHVASDARIVRPVNLPMPPAPSALMIS
jgi:hypothetical protein